MIAFGVRPTERFTVTKFKPISAARCSAHSHHRRQWTRYARRCCGPTDGEANCGDAGEECAGRFLGHEQSESGERIEWFDFSWFSAHSLTRRVIPGALTCATLFRAAVLSISDLCLLARRNDPTDVDVLVFVLTESAKIWPGMKGNRARVWGNGA